MPNTRAKREAVGKGGVAGWGGQAKPQTNCKNVAKRRESRKGILPLAAAPRVESQSNLSSLCL